MRRGVDYSWARPDPIALTGNGYAFVVRYISNDHRTFGGPEKNLTLDEAKTLHAAGIDIVLVWEGVALNRDPLKGYPQGVADGHAAIAAARSAGAPDWAPIYFAVDWNATPGELSMVGEYFRGLASVLGLDQVGVYGGYRTVKYLLDLGRARYAWQTYGWSTFEDPPGSGNSYLHWDERAQLRQVLNDQRVGGAAVDLDEAHADQFGQWQVTMTYAPQDLLNVRAYLATQTGLPEVSLGIVGDEAHSNSGYHIGATGVASFDYSRDEANPLSRDNPDPLTAAASAVDLGGDFPRFREITLGLVAACEGGDPRTRDIREVIYTPDGVTVRRYDREGVRDTGDSSHLTHTHVSFYRDSEGRRDAADNFLGLMRELFEGIPSEEDDDMFAMNLAIPHKIPVYGKDANNNDVFVGYRWHDDWPDGDASYTVPTVNAGIVPWGAAWLSLCNDTFGDQYAVRVAGGNGGAHVYANPQVMSNLTRWYVQLDNNTAFISLRRVPVDANDTMTIPVSACIEYARR